MGSQRMKDYRRGVVNRLLLLSALWVVTGLAFWVIFDNSFAKIMTIIGAVGAALILLARAVRGRLAEEEQRPNLNAD